jgi:hypothetical protein
VWHKVDRKYNSISNSDSVVMKCVQTDITCEVVGLGCVRLGKRMCIHISYYRRHLHFISRIQTTVSLLLSSADI